MSTSRRDAPSRIAVGVAVAAVAACLIGGGRIAVAQDGAALAALGLLVLLIALGVLAARHPRAAARGALLCGGALTAEGLVVGWLGHMGEFEVAPGLLLLLVGAAAQLRPVARARTRVAASSLLIIGGVALASGLAGLGGEALVAHSADGRRCLAGFAGEPGTHPEAPADLNSIRVGFGWWPVGLTCSWSSGLPAAEIDRITLAAVEPQTTVATSVGIYGSLVAGAALLVCGAALSRRRL